MNYYNILGIPENATQQEIKSAYRNMMNAFHPDHYRGPNKAFAEQKTKELIEAYEVLKDPGKRAEYDRLLEEQGLYSHKKEKEKESKDEEKPKSPTEGDSGKTNASQSNNQDNKEAFRTSNSSTDKSSTTNTKARSSTGISGFSKVVVLCILLVLGFFAGKMINGGFGENTPTKTTLPVVGTWEYSNCDCWDEDGNDVETEFSGLDADSTITVYEDGSIYFTAGEATGSGYWEIDDNGTFRVTQMNPDAEEFVINIGESLVYLPDDDIM